MPPPPDSPRPDSPAATRVAVVLFLVCLAYNLGVGAVGWNNTILDFFANRQAQTALSTYTQLGHKYALAYETPVMGPPWSMPFEFPLYNWIVAAVTTVSGWPLDQCGRLVSRTFFLLSLLPCYHILRLLQFSPAWRLTGLSLLLVSPFYVFWSRTFLMESTALCLGLAYFACAFSALENPRPRVAAAALVLGVLAALVKITTFAGFFLLLTLLAARLVADYRRGKLGGGALVRRLVLVAVLLVPPTVAGVLWTRFADGLKSQNQFARYLTSAGLWTWNFGTLGQRLHPRTWGGILKDTHLAVGYVGTAALLPLAAALVARRRRAQVAVCLAAYLSLPLVFTNLYYQHEYYRYANNVFLIAAVAIGLVALYECGGRRRLASGALLAALLALAPVAYAVDLYPVQAANHVDSLNACRAAREVTAPDEMLVVVGCDWSAEVPYYSRRRAMMIPVWHWFPPRQLPQYLEAAKGYRVGALVIHWPEWHPHDAADALDALHRLGLTTSHAYADSEFDVYRVTTSQDSP